MLALLAILTSTGLAAEATVPRIEGVSFFIDANAGDGVRVGDPVDVLRVVEVPDPGSGRVLKDRFTLGTAEVVEVGEHLSLVRGDPQLRSSLRVGDIAITPDRAPQPEPVVVAPRPDADPGTDEATVVVREEDPAVTDFLATFEKAQGLSLPTEKARQWRGHLRRHPEGSTRSLVEAELEALAASASAASVSPGNVAPPEKLKIFARAPSQAWEDHPVSVAVTVPDMPRVVSGALFYRRTGEETWRHVVLDAQGDTAMVGHVPADAVQPPGLEWYAAVQDIDGVEARANGPETPGQVTVKATNEPPGVENRSEVRLAYEFVDFYQMQGVDRWQQVDADYLYRVDRGPLYSVRLGYGFYGGVGAPVAEIDSAPDLGAVELVPVGFKFGYTELEFRIGDWVGLAARGITGVQIDGFAVGMMGRLRIGKAEGTSLVLAASTLGDIGNEFEVEMAWDTVERVPMQAGVYVTNQPGVSKSDYGVRLVYEARFEVTEHVQIGGRVGYQLRNINHGGPAFGATTVFAW